LQFSTSRSECPPIQSVAGSVEDPSDRSGCGPHCPRARDSPRRFERLQDPISAVEIKSKKWAYGMIRLIHFRKATESVVNHKRTFLVTPALVSLADCRSTCLKLRKWPIYMIYRGLTNASNPIINLFSALSTNVSICKLTHF